MNEKEAKEKKKDIDRMFNDMMAIGKAVNEGAVFFDAWEEVFDKMSVEEVRLCFKYATNIGKLQRKGKTEEEIEAIIEENRVAHRKELKEKGLL